MLKACFKEGTSNYSHNTNGSQFSRIMLNNRGWKVVSVHGDKAQTARTEALSLFKGGKCPLMVFNNLVSKCGIIEIVTYILPADRYRRGISRTGYP